MLYVIKTQLTRMSVMILALMTLLLVSCGTPLTPTEPAADLPTIVPVDEPTDTPIPVPTLTAQEIVAGKAAETIQALQAEDMEALAALVHPTDGVRFTPQTYVSENDLVFTAEQLPTMMGDSTVYTWGYADGSGFPIEATFAEYNGNYDQRNYADAQLSFNNPIGFGNATNNSAEFYPDSIIVEYHFPGFDPEYGGMDWESLRLVFQETAADSWALVGIIHASWTI